MVYRNIETGKLYTRKELEKNLQLGARGKSGRNRR